MPSLADLIRMGKQYIGDAMPGGSLNPETAPVARQANYLSGILDPASQVSQDATNWHKRTQIGLKDQLAGRQTPEAEQAYQTMMMAAGMAPIGMTAWHGSPHKFDKFSLDKIGTGEGAQAYGHGLYLAESPEVAVAYRNKLATDSSLLNPKVVTFKDGTQVDVGTSGWALNMLKKGNMDAEGARAAINAELSDATYLKNQDAIAKARAALRAVDDGSFEISGINAGSLYKTDIPDEAVARFLDWDKPIAMQEPHIKDALKKALGGKLNPDDFYSVSELASHLGYGDMAKGSDALKQSGIPGIRYLDGGSRSAGQGSSNFVVFDPEMIRILERNGVPTGQKPWNPNEYRPLSDLMNPRID